PEIFAPFRETIEQLSAITTFETVTTQEQIESSGVLSLLRKNLFNPLLSEPSDELQFVEDSQSDISEHNESLEENQQSSSGSEESSTPTPDKLEFVEQGEIRYLECGDRDTEIRAIAKEVKRLTLTQHYQLNDIALVVRQRDAYAKTIARVMREEGVPCKLETRVDVNDVPATRAVLKLLELLEQPVSGDTPAYRVSDVADLIKSEYFRLSDEELANLSLQFD